MHTRDERFTTIQTESLDFELMLTEIFEFFSFQQFFEDLFLVLFGCFENLVAFKLFDGGEVPMQRGNEGNLVSLEKGGGEK